MNESCDSIPLSEDVARWKRDYSTGPLTEEEFDKFFRDGFVVKKDILNEEILQSVKKSIEQTVDLLAKELFQAVKSSSLHDQFHFIVSTSFSSFQGKITNLHEDKGFYQRLTAIDQDFPGTAVLLHKRGVLPKEIRELWSCPTLLGIAKQLLGGNVAGHPVWNLRSKVCLFSMFGERKRNASILI